MKNLSQIGVLLGLPFCVERSNAQAILPVFDSAYRVEISVNPGTAIHRIRVAVVCSENIKGVELQFQDGTVIQPLFETDAEGGTTFLASLPVERLKKGRYFIHVVSASGYCARKFDVK